MIVTPKNVMVLMAEVGGVDTDERTVKAGPHLIPYDLLVLATGATRSYFGYPERAAVAPGLKRIADATSIRQFLLQAFENAESG